jgi:serine/threonine protein kinase
VSELIFDKYEIQHRLAVGGMGEVFYAVQRAAVKGFERPVILKNLLPDLAQQDGFIEQFLDEARVAATLNHPNVVSIYEVGLWNGTYFIAMEYIHGRNLSQLIKASLKKNLPIPPAVVARIIHDAAVGLEHAHSAKDTQGRLLNIVHRDISPQNIMVRDDGVTKVVDFGIARASNRTSRTATGAVKGKLAYMAPEQVTSRNVTGLADQFALGVVLWEMCTRRRLFHSERDLDLVKMVMEAEIPRPSLFAPGLPEDLDEVCLRMMQRDPNARFASIAEVARELEAFLVKFSPPSSESPAAAYMRQLGVEDLQQATPSNQNFVISLKGAPEGAATVTTPSRPPAAGEPKPKKRAPVGLIAALGGLLLLAGAGAAVLASRQPPPPLVPPPEPVARVEVEPPKHVEAPPAPVEPEVKPLGKLVVSWAPASAVLRVDGRKKGESPQTLEVPAGQSLHLQLEKAGFNSLEQDATAEPGAEQKLELRLTPAKKVATVAAAPAPSNDRGYLTVDTTPWSRVSVDGDPLGSTPVFKKPFTPGKHTVVMEGSNGVKATRTVEIRPNEIFKLQVQVN